MTEIAVTIRMRPTRIGFLVRPTDMASVRRIMRVCTCLWGGIYNPIIPVFRTPPKEWVESPKEQITGLSIAKGYISFFEPDLFVESEDGLLEKAGLGALRESSDFMRQFLSLKEFLEPRDHRDWSEPAFGLDITEALGHVYESEQRFQLRNRRPSVLIKAERSSGLAEAMFGVYPLQSDAAYFTENYKEVFVADELRASTEVWKSVFIEGAHTPLKLTRYGLDTVRYWYHDRKIFVFDPMRPTDLIDLWNLRIEPCPAVPIPIDWFDELVDEVCELIKAEHRPVRGNPNGLMHHLTIEFARSIPEARANDLIEPLKKNVPADAFSIKHRRTRIWEENKDYRMRRESRVEVTAKERRTNVEVKTEAQRQFEPTPLFGSPAGRVFRLHRGNGLAALPDFISMIGALFPIAPCGLSSL